MGGWLARRGYDVLNTALPGKPFDYKEARDINPKRSFAQGTYAEGARYLRGRQPGMTDEEWEAIKKEGKEAGVDLAWDILPIGKLRSIPIVSGVIKKGTKNLLTGSPNQHASNSSGSSGRSLVVPTVSGAGVTTTEKPIAVNRSAKPRGQSGNKPKPIKQPNTTDQQQANQQAGLPADWVSPTFTNRSDAQNYLNLLQGNQSGKSTVGISQGGTRGFGVQSYGKEDFGHVLDALNFGAGFGGLGYRGVTGELKQYDPRALENQDLYNTVTGKQVFVDAHGGENTSDHLRFQQQGF